MSAVRKMSNPQWKNAQSPLQQDPAILSFQSTPSVLNISAIRETGVVEKLLHSYGFIQCCERDARLFFHFSEYNGDMNTVKVGDGVEFQMSSDRRTGRPVACMVNKVTEEPSCEVLSKEKFTGSIVLEAKPIKNKNEGQQGDGDNNGRVTYEHNGEWFFIPYAFEDIADGNYKLKTGDQVTFFLATDKRNGNVQARKVEPLHQQTTKRFQGVVCSLKESFGFIERADAVKEIFFHYSEYKGGDIGDLMLGDDVEFDIQVRNTKEVAVNITNLPVGSVVFEDTSVDRYKGKIAKTLKSNRRHSDPFGGSITYMAEKGMVEIPYGDKDQEGDYTLYNNDTVEFNIATDRRDKLQRATSIQLCKEMFESTEERRERGVISVLKDGYGFIDSSERENRIFFHFSELIDKKKEKKIQDNVEFTVVNDPSTSDGRPMAIRIIYLPKGSVSFLLTHSQKYIGTIDKEPSVRNGKNKEHDNGGNIIFDFEGKISQISYAYKNLMDMKEPPRFGDKVEFQIGEIKRTSSRTAINVKVVLRNVTGKKRGFVAALRDSYGFIENTDHNNEVFFHFSAYNGDPSDLELGNEVEYTISRKGAKMSAENISQIPDGSIPKEEIVDNQQVLQGKVARPMRIVNPDQEEYCGLIQVTGGEFSVCDTYPYGITSLQDKKDFVQKDDVVEFQLAENRQTGNMYAVNVKVYRKYLRAKIDSIKGQFGFIDYEAEEEKKKLFFHMTEVVDDATVNTGDEVEFVLVQNQRNGKYSACNVRKIRERQRPERLVSRLKSVSEDAYGPRIVIIRQPKGPDNSPGFKQPRSPRKMDT